MRNLPASIAQLLKTMQAEQLIRNAIGYAINATADAVKGKTLTVDVGNAVIRKALQYIVDHAPGWLITWLGGETSIRQIIIARLDIEPAAQVTRSAASGLILTKSK